MDLRALSESQRPLTAGEIAKLAGVSESTIRNWTREQPPLQTITTGARSIGFTWVHLLEFCQLRTDLRGARSVLDRARALQAPQGAAIQAVTPPIDIESALSVARAMRSAAESNLDAALIAARQAEATARAHREQLEQLKATIAAYDTALSALTAPTTTHD